MAELNEDKVLKIEAQEVLKEVAYAVEIVEISRLLQNSDSCVYMNILTQEGEAYCIELSVQGFQIVGKAFDKVETVADSQYYETIYALLDSVSPEYRKSFGDALMNKLAALENVEDGEVRT